MNIVFILGAGASKEAGGPLMEDFLDVADNIQKLRFQNPGDEYGAFENVFQARAELRTVHHKSHLDLDNIESIFGAIEMGAILGKFGKKSREEIQLLRESIITLIYKTLEQSILFPTLERGAISTPEPYGLFVDNLREYKENHDPKNQIQYSFITFNYDLCLDFALFRGRLGFDYHLPDIQGTSSIPYLKLHGSINWGRCSSCDIVAPYFVQRASHHPFPGSHVIFDLGTQLNHAKCPKDDSPLTGPQILVPPTWDKVNHHQNISAVWAKASQCLEEANKIIFIGYSMPETDLFFRYLFALGTDSETHLKSVLVINPDTSESFKKRFSELFGPGLKKRVEFKGIGFGDAVRSRVIHQELEKI